MSAIVVFGAGGRAGRAILAEATRRGHRVTAVVRDPAKYPDLAAGTTDGTGDISVVAGDIGSASSVAGVVAGHDAVVHAAAALARPADLVFAEAALALLDGLPRAGVSRLVAIGMAANLEVSPGVRLMDEPDFPAEYLPFALGHTAGLHVLRAAPAEVDWVMLTPPMVLDEGPCTGRYRTGGDEVLTPGEPGHLSYADLAIAVLDEIETPKHHRTRIAVGD
ncbi:NAD(P)-dependent oxidoreductase [Amycolatopsis sp. 195334CR]|uniref:NAD(P)-dependent oxidoreductase n=1 Tax=Amycolatopsis sp. 195334CR TaxID=2814588 RepID=UPI001A8E389A|nr:NAD(P)H-binding protein [Amycolatopsis sp. 195334CR]MBN6035307.1 NAD(P)H-binding protein [Amycolatopsis sp. 195334CR]